MQIIKERIKFNNQDINLKISLSGGNKISGYQQEIDNITEETKDDLINPVIDNEVRRFSYKSSIGRTDLQFFFTANNTSYFNTFTTNGAGFTTTEISDYDDKLLNSFFILDFYDNFSSYTQTKIFTNYLTKVLDGKKSGSTPIPNYRIYSDTVNQLYNWYIPKSYLDNYTGSTVIGYTKFSFYNAKTGVMSLFYNKDNELLTTPEKMYFKTTLDLSNMTWRFTLDNEPNALAYEVPRNYDYVNRVNNTLENFDNQKQNYPDGNVFNAETGDYDTV